MLKPQSDDGERMRSLWNRLAPAWQAEPSHTPAVSIREIWRRFWPDARPFSGWILLSLAILATLPLIEAVEIWLFQRVVDDVLVPGNLAPFLPLAATYVGLGLASGTLSYVDSVLTAWIGQRFVLSVRRRLFDHLLRLSPDALGRRPRGDLLTRLSGDVSEIERLMLSGVSSALSSVLRVAFFVTALFLIDALLAVVTLLVTPLLAGLARRLTTLVKAAAREQRRRSGSLAAVAERGLTNLALIQSANRQSATSDLFDREAQAKLAASVAGTRYRALLGPIVSLLELSGVLGVIGLGGWAISSGRLTLGELLTFMTFLTQLYGPLRSLASLTTSLFAASAGAERIIELLDELPSVSDQPDARPLPPVRGQITFQAVSFAYPGSSRPALERIDLQIEPGERLALVGPSGAGKSTIAKLLIRFHDPDTGSIAVDGHELRGIQLASLRQQIAYLPQDANLAGATIGEAIGFARPDATRREIAEAARAAGIELFIRSLSRGYDTPISEGGTSLSGGQRQRLAVAMAILRDSPIVILDEPTAALDPRATRAVTDSLQRLGRERTVLIISHQLMTVRHADRIVVIDNGQIAEEGTHGALLKARGLYAQLWRLTTAGKVA